MDRRQFLTTAALGAAALAAPSLLTGCSRESSFASEPRRLSIPPLLDSRELGHDVRMTIQNGRHEFVPGVASTTRGYSGSYLGPTVRLYSGQDTRMRFENTLQEPTTVHGHGLHVPGRVDGGPQGVIEPGATWDVTLPIKQEASTCWYHPHLHGTTAKQVHAGLAGMYIIEDDVSARLPLPSTYGKDDIPIVVQDRDFTGDGIMTPYAVTANEMMNGLRENTLVVNGTLNPFLEVPKGWVRLRLLNGSNSRIYSFHLNGDKAFYQVATEGGFVAVPVELTSLKMSPGERNEILVDTRQASTIELLAELLPLNGKGSSRTDRVLELRVTDDDASGQLPDKLGNPVPWKRSDAVKSRNYMLNMDMRRGGGSHDHSSGDKGIDWLHMFGINGKSMAEDRIDEKVSRGNIEIWRIAAEWMEHPFHIHGASFWILSHDGQPPRREDQGWKDTVLIHRSWTEVIAKFDTEATPDYPYMYHCHTLEHEDGGMMGQFTVT